jgi:hypothetical protein
LNSDWLPQETNQSKPLGSQPIKTIGVLMKIQVFLLALLVLMALGLNRTTRVHWRNLRQTSPNAWNIYCATGYPDGQLDLIDGNGNPYWFNSMQNIFTPSNVYNGPLEPVYLAGPLKIMSYNVTDAVLMPGEYRLFQVQMGATDLSVITVSVYMWVTNTKPTNSPVTPMTVHWRSTTSINVLSLGSDADGDPLQYGSNTAATPSGCGTALWDGASNLLKFTGAAYVGLCQFTYMVSDGAESSAPALVNVTLTNSAPVTQTFSQNVHWRSTNVAFDVLSSPYATDADNDPLYFSNFTTVSPAGCATFSFTGGKVLVSSWAIKSGTCSIGYTITDSLATANGQISITLTNTAPATIPVAQNIWWNTSSMSIDPLAGPYATDMDNDPLDMVTLGAISPAGCGSFSYDSVARKIVITGKFNIKSGACGAPYTITDSVANTDGKIIFMVTENPPTNSSGNLGVQMILLLGALIAALL